MLFLSALVSVITWNITQGKIDNAHLEIAEKQLEIEKIEKSISVYEKLNALLENQRKIYDEYATLVHQGHSSGSHELRRKYSQIEEKQQEVDNVKIAIFKLTDKKTEEIKGIMPPLMPSGLRIITTK